MFKRIALPNSSYFLNSFTIYSTLLFILFFADSMMSYVTPVFLDKHVSNFALIGMIMSVSSLVGLLFDFYSATKLNNQHAFFFVKTSILLAILFPLCYIFFPDKTIMYFVAMAIWGVYYETMAFGNFHFVKERMHQEEYTKAWSIITLLSANAYLIGPLVASVLISQALNMPLYYVLLLNFVALALLTIFKKQLYRKPTVNKNYLTGTHSKLEQFQIWGALFNKVWPLWLLMFAIKIIDASFWSVGILLVEKLKQESILGNLFLIGYMVPTVLFVTLSPRLTKKLGKKRTAFITGSIGGVLLFLIGFSNSVPILVLLITLSSIFTAIAFPAINAAFEDYVNRLNNFGDQMIGLGQTAGSAAYIVGPIASGILAQAFGFNETFGIIGAFLLFVAVVGMIVVPRKIKMPQKELQRIDGEVAN